jgi:hypothetical protein
MRVGEPAADVDDPAARTTAAPSALPVGDEEDWERGPVLPAAATVIDRPVPRFAAPPERERRTRMWVGVGLAVLVVAVIVVVAIVAGGEPAAPPPTPTATPTPIATATLTPSPSPTPTPTVAPRERRLLSYVQGRIGTSDSCRVQDSKPSAATARVRCELPGDFPVVYTRFGSRAKMRAYFSSLGREGTPQNLGTCSAEGEWFADEDSSRIAGLLIGRRVGNRAVLSWTDDREFIAASARSPRGKRAALCRSWESYG